MSAIYNPAHLQTSRLRLRPFAMEDAGALFHYASDVEFSKYLSYDAPGSEEDAIGFLRMVVAGEVGTNLWAMTLIDKPEVIGAVQFNLEDAGVASLHYEIARWLWGQGLVSEGVAVVLDWAKTAHPEVVELRADAHIENKGSRRILEKFGFTLTAVEEDIVYYSKIL
jgi:[ribosomal protein S5]-alanine N-acetyltransferase